MENIDIPPFYVGQEIVAIRDHSQLIYKKGDEFTITSIRKSPCGKCKHWTVTIGIINDRLLIKCPSGHIYDERGKEWNFAASNFSPKLQFTEFLSMKEIKEKALELTSVN